MLHVSALAATDVGVQALLSQQDSQQRHLRIGGRHQYSTVPGDPCGSMGRRRRCHHRRFGSVSDSDTGL